MYKTSKRPVVDSKINDAILDDGNKDMWGKRQKDNHQMKKKINRQ